jgi:hypothetical protein
MTPVSFSHLQDAFEFASTDGGGLNEAFLDRETGRIHFRSDYYDADDEEEELPEDPPADRYLPIPDRKDLDLGRRMVLDFARQCLPDDFDEVRDIFSRRGAYARFKALLARRRAIDRWHDFSNKAEEAALRQWCADNDVPLKD